MMHQLREINPHLGLSHHIFKQGAKLRAHQRKKKVESDEKEER